MPVFKLIIQKINAKVPGFLKSRSQEKRLHDMLTNMPRGVEWRSIEVLSKSIGANQKRTTKLLIKMGAKRSNGHRNVWKM